MKLNYTKIGSILAGPTAPVFCPIIRYLRGNRQVVQPFCPGHRNKGSELMDILGDMLNTLRLDASIFLHASFCNAWNVDVEDIRTASFHLVSRGNCYLHRPDKPPVALNPGDLVFIPRNAAHNLCDSFEPPAPETPTNSPAQFLSGPSTTLICGRVDFSEQYWTCLINSAYSTNDKKENDANP